MFKIGILVAIVILSARTAFCQVDTMQTYPICAFRAADSAITQLILEDINNDSLKEIIVCSNEHIYVYSSMNFTLIWQSLTLVFPTDIRFADMDHDNMEELSCRSNNMIYIFNLDSPNNFWISPTLDNTYLCYDIGDRNADGSGDLIIIRKEPFTRYGNPSNLDTVWVDIYNGPYYTPNTYIIRIPNYNYQTSYPNPVEYFHYYETPIDVSIAPLSPDSPPTIFLFTTSEDYWLWYPLGWTDYSGNVWARRGDNLSSKYTYEAGEVCHNSTLSINDSTYLYTISTTRRLEYPGAVVVAHSKLANILGGDTHRSSYTIYSPWPLPDWDWRGYMVSDFSPNNPNNELAYMVGDEIGYPIIICRDLGTGTILWSRAVLPEIYNILFKFHLSIFSHPQVVCQNQYNQNCYFYDGANGNPAAVLLDSGYYIKGAADYDNDGNDELYAIHLDSLYVLGMQRTEIDENPKPLTETLKISNYPDPFNLNTTIKFELPRTADVQIDIFDILGRRVSTKVEKDCPAGINYFRWNATNMSSGVYVCMINVGGNRKINKMLLLK